MREWRSTLLFLILLSCMGCLLLALQIRQQKVGMNKEVKLISNVEAIDHLTFTSPSNTLFCRLGESYWEVRENQGAWYQANAVNIQQFLRRVSRVEPYTVTQLDVSVESADAWTGYGITSESLRIGFQSGNEHRLLVLGAKVELEDKIYVLDETYQRLYTSDKEAFTGIPLRADELLSRSLFLDADVQIDQIEMSGLLGYIELIHQIEEGWLLSQPRKGFLHQQAVHQFIYTLRHSVFSDILTEEITDFSLYGLDEDALRITMSGLSEGSFTLAIGNPVPENKQLRYARRGTEQRVVLIDQSLYEAVIEAFKKFRATQVLDMQDDLPTSLTWRGIDQEISLVLDEQKKWKMTRPYNWMADEQSVTELIEFLRGMAITRFNVERYDQYDQTDWGISFTSGGRDEITLMTADDADAPMQIRFADEGVQHEINRVRMRSDFFNPLYFKSRKLFAYDVSEIAFIERHIDQYTERLSGIESSENRIDNPSMSREEQVAYSDYLTSLNVKKYIANFPSSFEIYGLDAPRMRIKIGLNVVGRFGNELWVGAQTDEGYYAMIKGRNMIFLLSQDQIDRLFYGISSTK